MNIRAFRGFTRRAKAVLLALLLGAALPASALAQEDADEPAQGGTVSLQLRAVYEHNDTGNATDAADAGTLRTRLGYRTRAAAGSNVFLQFQDVTAWLRNYAPLDEDHDTVPDPEGTTVYQAYLENQTLPATRLRAGRQEIQFEDGRYVAVSNWRQQGQSFEAVLLETKALPGWTVSVANANRILGAAELQEVDHFAMLEADFQGIEGHHIYLHAFLLDSPGGTPADRDSATYGVRITGGLPAVEYFLQYDMQQAYADNSDDGGYLLDAFAAVRFAGFRAGPGYNVISGADGSTRPFDTLFGTTHLFNGYADQFTGSKGGKLTPGIRDTYLLVGGSRMGHRWHVAYHSFAQEVSSDAYGTELDAAVGRPITRELNVDLIFAMYTPDSGNDSGIGELDVTKYWVRADYKF